MKSFNQFEKRGNISFDVTYFFFRENEDILRNFLSNGILMSLKTIDIISKTQFINRIGFYQIALSKSKFFKIYVYPKIYDINYNLSLEDLLKDFNAFFQEYLRLRKMHAQSKGYKIKNDNLLDFNYWPESEDISEFVKKRYLSILSEVHAFFKANKLSKQQKNYYYSSDIAGQINIKKNVIEINKSKVHQIDNTEIRESILATITFNILKDFVKYKFVFLGNDEIDIRLKKLTNSLLNYISNNFSNIRILNNNQILNNLNSGSFSRNKRLSQLRQNLSALKGWESRNNHYKLDRIDSIWFSSEYMYEMKVYDSLIMSKEYTEVRRNNSKSFDILIDSDVVGKSLSKPDFIALTEKKAYIIDAKWKIINSIGDVNIMDVLKAHRDLLVHFDNIHEIILVFPKIEMSKEEYLDKIIEISYPSPIRFKIKQIDILE
ncbi:hypothetical protein VSO92_12665 [Myroides pelagicus]|uniref:hypothetical protein n=1 Tax=Myroides pelagicus TaxID=270914 RepID=UPI002DBFE5A6|nr:hypothetical protein [Myroides pelagicus]MEC4114955.1 hypothetical protein [Myroides pelagicus]